MMNENLDTTNKIIKPGDISPSDDEVIRQLSDNLQDITPEDVDAMCDEMDEAKRIEDGKGWEIPQELKNFREAWIEKIENIGDESKEKIIKAAETIPVNVETENDGSRLIEFKLGSKTRKILDPKLEKYSEGFRPEWRYIDSINTIYDYNYVVFDGVNGEVDDWKNEKLRDYVKQKEKQGLHIPEIKEMGYVLAELGKKTDLDSEADQIAMLMYLTGMDGWYCLSMGEDARSLLKCNIYGRHFEYSPYVKGVTLCMIAYE